MIQAVTSYRFEDLDFDVIVPAIQGSYWGQGRSRDGIIRSFEKSYPVCLLAETGHTIGWARATSDTIYHAYIYDLQVLPEFRNRGFGTRLAQNLMAHPELVDVTGWMLSTKNQHGMYRRLGFEDAEASRYMSLKRKV